VAVALQPALIPSAADGSALPVSRIQAIVARQPDGVVLRDERFEVSPTAASWTLDVAVPVAGESVEVIVYLYLFNVDAGVETVQFSGRTDPITVEAGARLTNVDADIVRGPPTNLLVTSVSITSAPATIVVGESGAFAANVETSVPTTPEVFWTSLDPAVLTMDDSVGTGVAAGTAAVVASAGAFADTVSVAVVSDAVDSVRVLPDSADVQVGSTRTYTASLFDVNVNPVTRTTSWTTGNTSIATVNPTTGVVTGVAPGTTTVRATSEGVFDEAVVRVTAAPTGGATNTWLAGPGSWSNGAKWSLGRPPAPADTVLITQGTEYTVTLDVSDTIAKITIGPGITLSVGANGLTMTGAGNGPELEIQAGAILEVATGTIAAHGIQNAGTLRTLGVTTIQADSIRNTGAWRAESGGQILGSLVGPWFETTGLLQIEATGAVQAAPGLQLHYRSGAIAGPGFLSMIDGSITLYQNVLISDTHVALQGTSILQNDSEDLTIAGDAILQIISTGGRPVDIDVGALTLQDFGALFVTGPLTSTSAPVLINDQGSLDVIATGGPAVFETGDIESGGTIILGGDDDVTLNTGAGTIWNRDTGLIEIVPFTAGGRAVLNGQLQNDGEMLIAGPTELIREDAAGSPVTALHSNSLDATITLLDGGDFDLYLGGSGPTFTNAGTITVYDGATLYVENQSNPPGQIIAATTAVFEGDGAVDLRGGPPTYPALTGVNHGTIAPGLFGPGIMTWFGTVPMFPSTTGRIAIDIGGPTPGTQHDQLNISAQLFLNGNGTLDLNWGYSPYMDERFAIVSYGTRVGNFAAVNLNAPQGIGLDTVTVVTASPSVPDTFVVVVTDGPPAPAGGIVGDWTLDEGVGQLALDATGQGNHGTLGTNPGAVDANDPTWLAVGRVGPALSFNGSHVVVVPDHATLEPTQLTVEAFVRATSPGFYSYVVSKGGGPTAATNASYALYTGATGGLYFYTTATGNQSYLSPTPTPASIWNGSWHHVAGTYDGSTVRLFVDGVEVGTGSAVGAPISYATPTGDLTIGALNQSVPLPYNFIGDIDEVRVYDRVLTLAEIQARAARGGP
jgi:hypothetical protein